MLDFTLYPFMFPDRGDLKIILLTMFPIRVRKILLSLSSGGSPQERISDDFQSPPMHFGL